MKIAGMVALAVFAMAQISEAGLVGTEVMRESIFQSTASSPLNKLTLLHTIPVRDPGVEIPSLKALQVSNPSGLHLVDTAIDIGNNFIEISFANSAPDTSFAPGFFNGSVYTFNSSVAPSISGALIDRSVTTLGLADSDVTFSGNKLAINVEGLRFNTSTFARINLTVEGGPPAPVPVPAAFWLFSSGLAAVWQLSRRGKATV